MEEGVRYNVDQEEFMMAFTAVNYDTGVPLSDPRYVKWVTAYWERVGGEWIINWFPMHKCSGAEMARFKNPENDLIATRVNKLQTGGHFFCLDFKAMRFELYGSESKGVDFSALDPMLVPCASRIKLFDGSEIGAEDNCVWD